MSEIKGQLLGVLLVISIFGIVAAAMTSAFRNASGSVGNKIEKEANQATTAASSKAASRVGLEVTL